MDNSKKIAFYTLGCKVNQYETQALKEDFTGRGFIITDDHEDADIYVINTCTVTNLADRKSRQYIRRMKNKNPESIIAVIGCYAQVSPEEAASIEGVDLVIGNNEKKFLPEHIEKLIDQRNIDNGNRSPYIKILTREELSEYEEGEIITSMESRTRAYIKIQDGCDRFCSYCIIPYARGPIRSRSVNEIIMEAESLIQKGFKELILTGINTALYGAEKKGGFDTKTTAAEEGTDISGIESVIESLNNLEGDFRIRLSSLEPNVIDASLAKRLLKYEKLCHHFHLSLQSGSDKILKEMNRHYDRSGYLKIIEALRSADKHYGITTDVIVGFPGETEEDFNDSIDIIKKTHFIKTHVFPYSKRHGTKAASMEGHIESHIKKDRSSFMLKVAEESALQFLQDCIGTIRTVLFEEYDEETGLLSGYSDNYIKVYVEVPRVDAAMQMINNLQPIELECLYKDGIKGYSPTSIGNDYP